jgi:GNAT superfamily N-acetyltransferase
MALMDPIQIRPLAASDSLDELTSMLHRAFSPLGRLGLNCTGVSQSIETTAQRVRLGECLVAVCGGRLIGTLTLHRPERRSECRRYREADVASLHQFAVDPRYQGTGCGKALLLAATCWARERGFGELALDTPADAEHLIDFYRSQGFRVVDDVQLAGRSYRSGVLSKTIGVASSARPPVPAARYAPLFGAMVQA